MAKNEFNPETEHPDVLNPSGNGFSCDVLCYSPRMDVHAIGWFDFTKMKWSFIFNEEIRDFVWRYFDDKIDKP